MLAPTKSIWADSKSSEESPWLVQQLKDSGQHKKAMSLLDKQIFADEDLFSKSFESGNRAGIANKAWRAFRVRAGKWAGETHGDVISKDEANAKYGIFLNGNPILTFDEDIDSGVARYLRDNKLRELTYNSITERALASSKWNYAPILAGSLFGSATDVGELSLGWMTGGLAASRYGAFVGRSIKNGKIRTTFRGTTFGLVESGIGEYPHHQLSDYLKEDYTLKDTGLNLLVGSGLGTLSSGINASLGRYDETSNLRKNTIEEMVEDSHRYLMENKSNREIILSKDEAAVAVAYKDEIDARVQDQITKTENEVGRPLNDEEKGQINEIVTTNAIPELMEKAQVSVAKDISETHELTVSKEYKTEDLDYSTDKGADASDQALSSSLEEELGNQGIQIKEGKAKAEEVDTDKKFSKKEEVEEEIISQEEVDAYSDAAVIVSKKLFPNVDVGFAPEGTPKNIRGYFDEKTGKIYINKGTLFSPEETAEVLLEEIVGHKGIRSVYKNKKRINKFFDYVYKQHKDEIDGFRQKGRKVYGDQYDDIHVVIDEWIAQKRLNTETTKGMTGAISPGIMKTIKADVRRLLNNTNAKNYDFVDSALYTSSLNMRSRSLESAITQGINLEKFTKEEKKNIDEINFQKENYVKLLNEDLAERKRIAKENLDKGMSEAKARGEQSRIKSQQKIAEANVKAAEKRAGNALKMGYAKQRGKISKAKFDAHVKELNAKFFGKDAELEGLSEYEKLAKQYADHESIDEYVSAKKKLAEINKRRDITIESQRTYQKYKQELAEAEAESKAIEKEIKGLEAESKKIDDQRKARGKSKKIQEWRELDERDEAEVALEEMGLGHLRFSKVDPEKRKKQIKRSREKVKKVKEAYAKTALDNAQKDAAEMESIKDVVDVTITVDGKEYSYKLPLAQKLNALKDIAIQNRLIDRLSNMGDKERIGYLHNLVEGQMYNQYQFINNKYQANLSSKLKARDLWDFLKSEGNIKELYKASKGQSKNKKAIETFEIIQDTFRGLIREQNLEGGRTAFLEDHLIPRVYSGKRITEFFLGKKRRFTDYTTDENKAVADGYVDWVMGRGQYKTKDGLPRLDLNRMYPEGIPSNESIEATLRGMVDAVNTNSNNVDGIVNSSNLANKSSVSRKIHFRNAEDDYFHDKNFGAEDTVSSIYYQIDSLSRNVALLKTLGTNPERMLSDKIIPSIKEMTDNQDYAMKEAYDKVGNALGRSLKIFNKNATPIESATFSKMVSNIKAFTNIAKMGSLLFTSASDVAFRGLALRNLDVDGDSVVSGYTGLDLRQDKVGKYILGKDDEMNMLNNYAMNSAMSTAFMNRFDPDNMGMNGLMAKIQHQFFNVNGMNWWNKWIREGFIVGAVKRMGSNSFYSMDQLRDMPTAKLLLEAMEDSGINADDWEIIRSLAKRIDPDTANVSAKGADKTDVYLTLDMVQDMDENIIARKLGKSPDSLEVSRYINDLQSKYGAFLARQMDVAVLTPGLREQRLLGIKTVEGTMANGFAKLAMQYKSFPVAMYTKIMSPQFSSIASQGFVAGGGVALLGTIATAIGIQAVSMQMKDIANGRSARPWDGGLLWDAFVKSGAGTIVMDLLRDYEGVHWDDILGGPAADLTLEGLGLVSQGFKSTFGEDTGKDFGINFAKFAKHWFPAGNHPVMKATIVDPAFNMAADWFNPETLRRTEAWYRGQGQFYYMNSPTGRNQPFDLEDILTGLE